MSDLLSTIKDALWGVPLLTLLICVGIYLTIVLRGIQFRYLFRIFSFSKDAAKTQEKVEGDISPFQSVMTATASAVGTGSIVGVAVAVSAGGFGSIFWLWIASIISMAIKYAESVLAVRYRELDTQNEMSGGPMYYIERGLGWKKVAAFFAIVASMAAIATGCLVQVNSIAAAMDTVCNIAPWKTGLFLTFLTGFVLMGGIQSIGKVAAYLVPIMAISYVLGGFGVIAVFYEEIPKMISLIISSAFTGQAAAGGFLGSTAMLAVQVGVARSLFCSEAGLGISSIAAAAARTSSSSRQALLSMVATLISTAVICTVTACVIGVSGVLGEVDASGVAFNGTSLVIMGFNKAFSFGKYIVMIGLILFSYSTVLAWAYYGEKCFEYLFGARSKAVYRGIYTVLVIPGAVFTLDIVWSLADIMNALMVLPNMIALLALSGVVRKETDDFLLENEKKLALEKVPVTR